MKYAKYWDIICDRCGKGRLSPDPNMTIKQALREVVENGGWKLVKKYGFSQKPGYICKKCQGNKPK